MEGATQPLSELLERLTGRAGHGIEVVSKVNDIPKGSRLAVSTNLLACLIAVCMRATNQIHALAGSLEEHDRRLVAARAILGEWLVCFSDAATTEIYTSLFVGSVLNRVEAQAL